MIEYTELEKLKGATILDVETNDDKILLTTNKGSVEIYIYADYGYDTHADVKWLKE